MDLTSLNLPSIIHGSWQDWLMALIYLTFSLLITWRVLRTPKA